MTESSSDGGLLLGLARAGAGAAAEFEGGAGEAAGIEHHPDLLGALGGELPCYQVGAAGGGGPGDVAQLVAGLVVTQGLELAADAAQAQAALLQLDLAGAHQEEVAVLIALARGGEDAYLLLCRADGPATDEAERAGILEVDAAERDVAAPARVAGLGNSNRITWIGDEGQRLGQGV